MAASSTATLVRIKRSGMGVIAPTAGLAALAAILAPAGPLNAQVPELLPNLIAPCLPMLARPYHIFLPCWSTYHCDHEP